MHAARAPVVWRSAVVALWALSVITATPAFAQSIVVASTTSTEQSGLFRHLLPVFKQATGIDVKVVALGTGQALDMARRGDADVLVVHDPAAEAQLVADGVAVQRHALMSNDFVLVGPQSDPARTQGLSMTDALHRVAATHALFVSRGDRSGTHAAEQRLWNAADEPPQRSRAAQRGRGYRECGCGMGAALNMAAATHAYVLTDRATWLTFQNRGELVVLVQGDPRLFNPYSVMRVDAAKHPHINAALGQQLVDWLLSPQGQAAIASHQVNGESLFIPSARSTSGQHSLP